MPKISVIVPVYNTEKYIEKCLKSLDDQTMKDFEVVIVNDGSKDESERAIKNYMRRTRMNIKYLKKEYKNLQNTRNLAKNLQV